MTPLRPHSVDILKALEMLVKAVGDLPENARGTVQGLDLNGAYLYASQVAEAAQGNPSALLPCGCFDEISIRHGLKCAAHYQIPSNSK